MTRKHFTIFVEVCRFLNFSQAAEALNTTQPAVSLAVKELESHYGVALFERMNRRVYLTPAGEALLATAQDVLRGFQEAEETWARGGPWPCGWGQTSALARRVWPRFWGASVKNTHK